MSLNGRNGALVKYEAPSKSWRDLVQRYFENGKRCDVQKFTEFDGDGGAVCDDGEGVDLEMADSPKNKGRKKRKRKSVRLHPSYAGFTGDGLVGKKELKQIANRCYAAKVGRKETESVSRDRSDAMDCD